MTEGYEIDRKLKPGKDYPFALETLIEAFKGGRMVKHTGPGANRARMKEGTEITRIEKMFFDYFHYQARLERYEKRLCRILGVPSLIVPAENKDQWPRERMKADGSTISKEWKKEFPTEEPIPIIESVIKKVNAKLKLANPQLLRRPSPLRFPRFYLESIAITRTSPGASRKYSLSGMDFLFGYWGLFARCIAALNPRLVKKCEYCGRIYFSRQRKKYHSECRSKFFSEKYTKEGQAAERQRAYRLRKKKNAKKLK